MSRNILYLFSLILCVKCFCFGEFPFTNPVLKKSVPQEILEHHKILKAIIAKAPHIDLHRAQDRAKLFQKTLPKNIENLINDNNYFATDLMFYLEDEPKPLIFEIQSKYFPAEDFYCQSKALTIEDHFVSVNLHFSGKAYIGAFTATVVKNIIDLQTKFFNESNKNNDISALVVGDSFKTINTRMTKKRIDITEPSYILLNTDSEAYMFAYLEDIKVQQNIFSEIKKKIGARKVLKIVFNGCTTRAMCGLCGLNINMLQYLSNDTKREGCFLNKLKDMLIKGNNADEKCVITSYISCLRSEGSPYFSKDFPKSETIKEQFVNIFTLN